MPHYKLTYFDGRGRAEAIRQVLALAGAQYEDVRLDFEEWGAIKKTTPLGQLPVLEADGVQLAPTQTILRYIGNAHGLAGSTPLDHAKLDMIAEVVQDLSSDGGPNGWGLVLFGAHPECRTKVAKLLYFKQKVVPAIEKYAPLIEKFLLENGNNGLLLGDKETWVDVFTAENFGRFIDFGEPDCLDAYPSIKKLISRVRTHPAIAEHIAKRPKSVA